MISINEIQNIISNNNPRTYYQTYKQHEKSYWDKIPDWIIELQNITSVLDIGIAYGTLGMYSKLNHNCDLYGIDFMKYISDTLVNNYDINYKINDIELEEFPWDKKFDLILFTEVFEHMKFSPIYLLTKIKNLISDNGVIMFSTPDADSWGKITKYYNNWTDIPEPNYNVFPDEHIYQYNLQELEDIFNIVELKIDRLDYSFSGENIRHFNMQLSKA